MHNEDEVPSSRVGTLNHSPVISGGLLADESALLLRAFFLQQRAEKRKHDLRATSTVSTNCVVNDFEVLREINAKSLL